MSNINVMLQDSKKNNWPWIVFGFSVGIFAVAAATVLYRKKQKAKIEDDPRAERIRDLIAEAERLLESQNKFEQ